MIYTTISSQLYVLTSDAPKLQISEDFPEILDLDIQGFPDRPINVFLPRLLQVF